jgi:hypothetical protein
MLSLSLSLSLSDEQGRSDLDLSRVCVDQWKKYALQSQKRIATNYSCYYRKCATSSRFAYTNTRTQTVTHDAAPHMFSGVNVDPILILWHIHLVQYVFKNSFPTLQ